MIALASMIAVDENAFICDMAETYQVYDYRRMPGRLLGILAAGLGPNTRIKQKINGVRGTITEVLLAQIVDGVNWLVWSKTKDAERGKNKPKSVASELFVSEDKKKTKGMTIEDFEKIREKVTGG